MDEDRRYKLVKVELFGQEFKVRSDEERQVHSIAEYLNKTFADLKTNSPALNRMDLLIMTAFKVAGDYYRCREELFVLKDRVDRKASELASRIDNDLSD